MMDRARLKRIAWAWRWTIAAAVMFGAWSGGYMAVGWWTADRATFSVAVALDAAIPLVPEFVLIYVAVYPLVLLPFLLARDAEQFWPMVRAYGVVLATCYLVFLFFPVALHHPPLAEEDFGSGILALVYRSDPPTNCLPSTHCAMSLLAAICLYRISRPVGWWALAVAVSIGVSTLFTKQHYVLDILAGWAVALLAIDLAWDGRIRAAFGRMRSQWALARGR